MARMRFTARRSTGPIPPRRIAVDFFGHRRIVDPSKRRQRVQRSLMLFSLNRIYEFHLYFGREYPDDDDDDAEFYEGEDSDEIHRLLSAAIGRMFSNQHSGATFEVKSVEGPSMCYFRMFADSLASMDHTTVQRNPITLCFAGARLDVQAPAAIASILERNSFVDEMRIVGSQIGTAGLQMLCDSVARNEHILKLDVHDDTVTIENGTIVHAVDETSPLTTLRIFGARWTEEAFVSLWKHMRTNQQLQDLKIGDLDEDQRGIFEELARDTIAKYNWTLEDLNDDQFDCLNSLFNENMIVREAVSELEDREYRVDHVAIWPKILDRVSSKPTLLYRFLRRNNCDSFCSIVLALNARRVSVRKRSLAASASAKDDNEPV